MLGLQFNDLAVHRAANGIAQDQDVLSVVFTLYGKSIGEPIT